MAKKKPKNKVLESKDNFHDFITIFILVILANILVLSMVLLNSSPTATVTRQQQTTPASAKTDNAYLPPQKNNPAAAFKRLLLKPKSEENNEKLRFLLEDIQHEFRGQFTANVPYVLFDEVMSLAKVEEVPLHYLHESTLAARPVCGNGIIDRGEKCGEEGLSCAEGQTCENCKCKKGGGSEPPAGKSCTPENQFEYNVIQVNGGQTGAGTGVTVAILDTGIYIDHPDLVNRIKFCNDATKRGIRTGCTDRDSVAHGTHVAGIIGADGGTDDLGQKGVAPGVDLMIIKVCGNAGCFADDIAAAINFAAQNGADIINMSFGGPTESSLIKQAIEDNPGILYIASAGNSGPNPNTIEFPGANPNVVAVAANDSNKIIAEFSARGIDDGDDAIIVEREVELSAGGVLIESTNKDGCYSKLSGTSFSAPTLAGLAANVWQGNASDTRNFLITITEDLTQADGDGAGVGFDIASGYGLPVAQ